MYHREAVKNKYIRIYNNILSQLLQRSGYCRYRIEDNDIVVQKSFKTFFIGTLTIILTNLAALHVLYETNLMTANMFIEEKIIVTQVNLTVNIFLIDMVYARTRSGSEALNRCIDVDIFLGPQKTEFIRDIVKISNKTITIFILIFQFLVVFGLNIAFEAGIYVRVSGSLFFIMCFSIMYDISFLMTLYININLKIRYLNTLLMKMVNMKFDYLPNISFFDGILWKTEFWDILSNDYKRDPNDYYTKAFNMIFDKWLCIQRIYRFLLLNSAVVAVVNTLLVVHTLVKHAKTEGMSTIRKSCIFSSLFAPWLRLVSASQQSDMVLRLIEQTKVICVYALLEANNDDKVNDLTRNILDICEVRGQRPSVYGLFHLDTGMVLHLAASIFVYITVLLQSGFTVSDVKDISYENVTANSDSTH